MTQIFLVRHGQSEGNLFRRVQGQTDLRLTAGGRAQLPYLQKRFAPVELAAVYSSPLRRARDTAVAIVGGRDIPLLTDERLIEMSFGAWEMRPWGEINREYPELKNAFLHDTGRWYVEGSESYAAVQERMLAVMTDLARANDGKTVAVASHGMAIRAFLACVSEKPPIVDNTSVTLLRYENGSFTVVYANDTSHLPAPPYTPFRELVPSGAKRCYDLRYRPYDLARDRERYVSCYRDAWLAAHGSEEGFDASACLLSAQLHAAGAPGCIVEALLEDDFAGILTLDERRGRERGFGWIAFLYVAPEFRGHHCGIQLIGTAAQRFRALGRRALRLTVAPENPALGFYEKAGFTRVGAEAGALGELLVMEWTL